MSLKEKIFASQDCDAEMLDVPEWDCIIEVRGMTGTQRSSIMDAAIGKDGTVIQSKLYPMLLIACCFDPDTGKPIFDDDDMEALLSKSAQVIERVASKASELSGIGAEAIKEAEKN